MDLPEIFFYIDAYKKQFEIEDTFILNHFRERRKKIEEDYPSRSKRRYFTRDHAAANQKLIDDYQSTYI